MHQTDPSRALSALRDATVAFAGADADATRTLRSALDHLIEVTGADAGAVAVPGDPGAEPRLVAERRLGGAEPVSCTALEATLTDEQGGPAITEPPHSQSVVRAGITSVLCVPVRRRGQTLAAVYLDRRGASPPFDEVAMALAESFAATLALSVDMTGRLEAAQALREQAEETAQEARSLAAHVHDFWRFGEVVTKSHRFAECLAAAERSARYHVDLLIEGETGTGKEHLARCIHTASGRRGRFVPVNCTALPETLAENELFGHEAGAFTGASRVYRGTIEQAADGTLFLDEIGDLPASVQPKLLRVLEDKRVRRIGGEGETTVDVRIVAATNSDLAQEVRQGRFREDLFYRLQVVRLRLPPLRERIEDLPALAETLLELACQEVQRGVLAGWEPVALRRLAAYSWPGNVRELKNAIKQLCVLVEGPRITARDVEVHLGGRFATDPASSMAESAPELSRLTMGKTLRERVQEAEREIIRKALAQESSVAAAARLLGVRRQTLYQRCVHLGIPLGSR